MAESLASQEYARSRGAYIEDALCAAAADAFAAARRKATSDPARDAEIACAHLGLDGRGGEALSALAERHGLSAERVRQVAARLAGCALSAGIRPPALERAASMLAGRALPLAAVGRALMESGISRYEFDHRAVLSACRSFGVEAALAVADAEGVAVLGTPETIHGAAAVVRAARRLVSAGYVARLAAVADEAGREDAACAALGQRRLLQTARDVLPAVAGFRPLDDRGLFWIDPLGGRRNLIAVSAVRTAAVARGLALPALVEALRRAARIREVAPADLAAAVRAVPELMVHGDGTVAAPGIDPRDVLSGHELVLFDILDAAGGSMPRQALFEAAAEAGVPVGTVSVALSYSPVLARPDARTVSLVGRGAAD